MTWTFEYMRTNNHTTQNYKLHIYELSVSIFEFSHRRRLFPAKICLQIFSSSIKFIIKRLISQILRQASNRQRSVIIVFTRKSHSMFINF